ncbi:MAG: DNA repair protein RecO [Deltaproteobacteria bacterium]|jgi:DNA repair protein RecO (recombination protein O)|nr:DNA repair protein RecO [Deltaproteobacteria bacterium]
MGPRFRRDSPQGNPPAERLAAVVLSRDEVGEADVVATFLTRERGLLAGFAKNAQKSRIRFGGGLLSPGTAAYYYFRIRANSDLCFVERGEIHPPAPTLPADARLRALASFGLELCRAFETHQNPATLSFELLVRYLSALSKRHSGVPPALSARSVSVAFQKLYLELAGFGLKLSSCADCLREVGPGPWRWDSQDPKILCDACAERVTPSLPRVEGSLLLKLAEIRDLKNPATFAEEELLQAEPFLERVFSIQAGRSFKSPRALRSYLRDPAQASQT